MSLEDILNQNPELKKKLIIAALAFEKINPDTGEVNPNFIYSSSDEEDQDYTTLSENASSSETEDDTVEEDTEHIEESNIIKLKDSPT